MKSPNGKTRSHSCFLYLALCTILVIMLSACGSGTSSSDSDDSSSDTGSIAFSLVFEAPEDSSSAADAQFIEPTQSPSGDVCVDYEIDTVNAEVYNSQNDLVASESWPCSDHGGKVKDVPTGTVWMRLDGIVSGTANWSKQKTNITITRGDNTDLGAVTMDYVGGDTEPPTVEPKYPAASATGVFVDTAVTASFSEDVVVASVNTSSCRLVKTGSSTPIDCSVDYDSDTFVVTITPDSNLTPNTDYTVTITKSVEDLAAHQMDSDESWSFKTGTAGAQTLIWDASNWDEALWD